MKAKYRLLAGSHAEETIHASELQGLNLPQLKEKAASLNLNVGEETDLEAVRTAIKSSSLRKWSAGEVFESNSDLTKLNSSGSKKFEKVDDHAVVLERATSTYTAAELRILADNALKAEQLSQQLNERRAAEKANPTSNPNPTLTQPVASVQSSPQKTRAEAFAKLDQMSVKDLTALAEDNEIDLKGATKREDILRILKADHPGKP